MAGRPVVYLGYGGINHSCFDISIVRRDIVLGVYLGWVSCLFCFSMEVFIVKAKYDKYAGKPWVI